jgi:uncharacterized protein YbbK (DUF523 family)
MGGDCKMKIELEYAGGMKFEPHMGELLTFVVDGVRITPEVIAGLIHPRSDVWWRCKREGDLVIVEAKQDSCEDDMADSQDKPEGSVGIHEPTTNPSGANSEMR